MINKVNRSKEFVGMNLVKRSADTGNPYFMSNGRTSKGGHRLYKVIKKF